MVACRSAIMRRLWFLMSLPFWGGAPVGTRACPRAAGGQHREHAACENRGQLTGHKVPIVRLAGGSGGPGRAVTLRLPVQVGDPALRDFTLDARVHCGPGALDAVHCGSIGRRLCMVSCQRGHALAGAAI
jgi:hypothetical protein